MRLDDFKIKQMYSFYEVCASIHFIKKVTQSKKDVQ